MLILKKFSSLFQIKDIPISSKKLTVVPHDLNKSRHIGNQFVIILSAVSFETDAMLVPTKS